MIRYNNKTYRIDDISWDSSPLATFRLRNGEEISFVDYYKRVSEWEGNAWYMYVGEVTTHTRNRASFIVL